MRTSYQWSNALALSAEPIAPSFSFPLSAPAQRFGSPASIARGETNVTLQTLKTLADMLKVRITDLLKGF
jgi:hypothetical protein